MSNPLLNCAQVRDFTLDILPSVRPGLVKKMTRVGEGFFDAIESRLRMRIFADVRFTEATTDHKTLRSEARQAEAQVISPRSSDLPWLINQSAVHGFATDAMKGTQLTQVSGDYMEACDRFVREAIRGRLSTLPSAGKTIQ